MPFRQVPLDAAAASGWHGAIHMSRQSCRYIADPGTGLTDPGPGGESGEILGGLRSGIATQVSFNCQKLVTVTKEAEAATALRLKAQSEHR